MLKTHLALYTWDLIKIVDYTFNLSEDDVPEDPEELVNLRITMEEGFLGGELGKDGANTPDVYGCRVTRGAQEHLWRSVPQRHHLHERTHTHTHFSATVHRHKEAE